MRYLSLFSGIEAATMAWHDLGWEPVAFSEIEQFPCAVLTHHYPDIPNLGDVTKITEEQIKALGNIDLVVFGSPCTDLSIAGKRLGFKDAEGNETRSGLFTTAIRIIRWARKHNGCRFALWENVPGAFSSNKGADFAQVVGEMAGLRDVAIPKNGWGTEGAAVGDNGMLEWACLDAQWFGLAQRRKRVFALVDFGDWVSRPPILLERHSLRGNTPPSREAGQEVTHDVAPCLTSSGRGVERAGDTRARPVVACFGGGNTSGQIDASPTLNAHGVRLDFESECFAIQAGALKENINIGPGGMGIQEGIAYTLEARAEVQAIAVYHSTGAGYWQEGCGTLRARPQDSHENLIAFSCKDHGADAGSISPTLRSMNSANSNQNAGGQVAIAFPERLSGTQYASTEDLSPSLCAKNPMAVSFRACGQDGFSPDVVTPPILSSEGGGAGVPSIQKGMVVRRLLPVECERLQGFPSGYTDVPYRGKPAADGPRYKSLGNSMAVPVMRYIGEQINKAITRGNSVLISAEPKLKQATQQEKNDALTDLFVGLSHAITEHGCQIDLTDPANIRVSK